MNFDWQTRTHKCEHPGCAEVFMSAAPNAQFCPKHRRERQRFINSATMKRKRARLRMGNATIAPKPAPVPKPPVELPPYESSEMAFEARNSQWPTLEIECADEALRGLGIKILRAGRSYTEWTREILTEARKRGLIRWRGTTQPDEEFRYVTALARIEAQDVEGRRTYRRRATPGATTCASTAARNTQRGTRR